jgi:hypothetical protein
MMGITGPFDQVFPLLFVLREDSLDFILLLGITLGS